MHLIKKNGYYVTYNENRLNFYLDKINDSGNVCVIDFESFQISKFIKHKYEKIDVQDVPFCVGVGMIKHDDTTNSYSIENKQAKSYEPCMMNEEQLIGHVNEMSLFLENYFKENKVEKLVVLAKFNEEQALKFMTRINPNLEIEPRLIDRMIDIYKFYDNHDNFNILGYGFTLKKFMKSFMKLEVNDQLSNQKIGIISSEHFSKGTNFKRWHLVEEHNINDLDKAVWLLNKMVELKNTKPEDILNDEHLNIEKNEIIEI
ncbi:hypothetical protein [[Acholeplasma] multilocale]|uniref:hypothetical protein n=1 Tax=[Acholeplasma] multilocale TaxID=264638 RepID=UPI00047ADD35|nr:hypothetical protein [[Acholeplasma] multilocale]